ncbi:hypothetical protein SESBI_12833 [Sesbania bispinosa]|nr:hypothetical protein SESBI_12833 [Sesbania bispinosa]
MIPRFDGKNAYWWLINVEQYFDGRGIPEEEKLSWAWLAMEEFDPDIWVQEEGSESWEKENRGKIEALKFKNQVGREEAIHKEVEQVKETNIKIVMAEKEMETELELHAGTAVEVQEADVADKIEGEESDADWEPPDWIAFVVPKTTPTEQVVVLLQRSVLSKGTRSKSRKKSTKMVNCQPSWILCKTFKQKPEAGLGEAFMGSWQQKGLRGFSFDPGGTWLSEVTSYSP